MSEEGTAKRSTSGGRVQAGPAAPRSASSVPAMSESESASAGPSSDVQTLVRRMAGKPANEVLARISNGDLLKLYPLCARRIRDTYFVLDPDRVFERALAMVAVGIEVEAESCLRPEWLVGTIDRAIERTLDHDREEERAGLPPENPEEHFRLFVEAFFVEPPLARLSAVRLNGLEERVRKGFQLLIVEGRPLEECLELGLGPPERLQLDILLALEAIGLIDEKGFGRAKGNDKEEQP